MPPWGSSAKMIGASRAAVLFMRLWRSCTIGINNSRSNNKISIDRSSSKNNTSNTNINLLTHISHNDKHNTTNITQRHNSILCLLINIITNHVALALSITITMLAIQHTNCTSTSHNNSTMPSTSKHNSNT